MIEDITSAPMTRTFLWAPVAMNCAPDCRAYTKAEQAAERSKPQTFFAPSLSCTRQAVEGSNMSGVTVSTRIAWMSEGAMRRAAIDACAAATARPVLEV